MNDWRDEATCKGADLAVFFDGDTALAQAYCRACPVRAECLEDALRCRDRHGYRGGLTEQERRKVLQSSDESMDVFLQEYALARKRGLNQREAARALGVGYRNLLRQLSQARSAGKRVAA